MLLKKQGNKIVHISVHVVIPLENNTKNFIVHAMNHTISKFFDRTLHVILVVAAKYTFNQRFVTANVKKI